MMVTQGKAKVGCNCSMMITQGKALVRCCRKRALEETRAWEKGNKEGSMSMLRKATVHTSADKQPTPTFHSGILCRTGTGDLGQQGVEPQHHRKTMRM